MQGVEEIMITGQLGVAAWWGFGASDVTPDVILLGFML